MADTAPAKSPAKKRAPKPKKPASHPKYSEMIGKAIETLKERGGSSRQAILKYVCATYKVEDKLARNHLKLALKAGVKNGSLKQSKGTGASGSFQLGSKGEKPKVKKDKKVKSPAKAAKKVKKPTSAVAKKSPKKVAAKKPKAAKKSPAKKAAPAAKPASVKKSPAKKAAKPKKAKSPKKKAAPKK